MLLIGLLITGCTKGRSPLDSRAARASAEGRSGTSEPTDKRLSLAEATLAVRQEVFRSNPKMNPAAEFPLRELTTPEIWDRLHAQVFMVTDGVYVDESYIIDHGKTSLIGAGFGGHGIMSLCVADLAGDGRPELVFTYSFGSGIHRSMVGIWTVGDKWAAADLALMNEDLSLSKTDDHNVNLNYGKFDSESRTLKSLGDFGAVRSVHAPEKNTVEILPSPDLPDKIKKLIMR